MYAPVVHRVVPNFTPLSFPINRLSPTGSTTRTRLTAAAWQYNLTSTPNISQVTPQDP